MYKVTAFFKEDIREINEDIAKTFDMCTLDESTARSLFYNDKIIAAGGIVKMWEGVGTAWAVLGNIENKRKVALLYKKHLYKMMIDNRFHRLQADILVGFDKGVRFVEFLGFKFEGTMKAYDKDKRDYLRYALVMGV